MKKRVLILFMLVLMLSLTGCGKEKREKPLIVCSIYPEYDWLMNVLGDEAEQFDIKLILNGDTDLHSYQPVAKDIADIIDCDMLIYVGGEGDAWIDDALNKNKQPKEKVVINLLSELGEYALSEEITEGMQQSLLGHGHDEEEEELDEHVWLSLNNAIFSSKLIENKLSTLFPEKTEVFKANCSAYVEKLEKLEKDYKELSIKLENAQIIVADRFPFRYLANDLNLKYYAAFSGCSADSEASFKTVAFLADKLVESGSNKLFVLENSDKELAWSIFSTAGINDGEILVLDSMQSKWSQANDKEYSYLSAMEYNYKVLLGYVS